MAGQGPKSVRMLLLGCSVTLASLLGGLLWTAAG